MDQERPRGYRSIFWPLLLIGVGVLWLMANLGWLPTWSWGELWRLWPLFLIGVGLDLLFGRRSPLLGAVLAIAVIALAAALIFVWAPAGPAPARVTTDTYSEPLGSASSARVEIGPSVGSVSLRPLAGGGTLFEAEVTHVGELEYEVDGQAERFISLRQGSEGIHINWPGSEDLDWTIGLSPDVPLELAFDGGVGDATLDLEDLQITDLSIEGDVGDIHLDLPAMSTTYSVWFDGGVGDADIAIEEGSALTLHIEGDVGNVRIDLPAGAAARVEATADVGSVQLPSGWIQIEGDQAFVGVEGVWETEGYDQADLQILIVFDGGVGDLIIR
jgi:hypothetical protein